MSLNSGPSAAERTTRARREPSSARAWAPGGIGNIGPGLDILGCALEGDGDAVIATASDTRGIRVIDPGHEDLPTDPEQNTAAIAAAAVLRAIGREGEGIELRVEKGLPLAGGQGGSAASAVAGAAAVNVLFGSALDRHALLEAALAAESAVAGRHADNVAAAVYGGILLIRSMDPVEVISLPVPATLRMVMVHPHHRLSTADARRVLPRTVDLATTMHQAAQVAAMVTALHSGDLALFGRAIDDRIAEPARLTLLPRFSAAKEAALRAGALGCSISGAGPSVFAVCDNESTAAQVGAAIAAAYTDASIAADARVTRIHRAGVQAEVLS